MHAYCGGGGGEGVEGNDGPIMTDINGRWGSVMSTPLVRGNPLMLGDHLTRDYTGTSVGA